MIIPALAAETHQVLHETQHQGARFVMGIVTQSLRGFLDAFERKISRWKLAQHFFDAFHFVARQQRAPELLQVNGRAKIIIEIADFVARDHVSEKITLLKATMQFLEQPLANLRFARAVATRRRWIEQAARILRLTEVIAQPAAKFLGQEVYFLLGRFEFGANFRQLKFEVRLPTAQHSQIRFCLHSAAAFENSRKKTLTAADFAQCFLLLFFQFSQRGTLAKSLFDEFPVCFLGAAKLLRGCFRDNKVAKKVDQQSVEILEAVRVLQEIT